MDAALFVFFKSVFDANPCRRSTSVRPVRPALS